MSSSTAEERLRPEARDELTLATPTLDATTNVEARPALASAASARVALPGVAAPRSRAPSAAGAVGSVPAREPAGAGAPGRGPAVTGGRGTSEGLEALVAPALTDELLRAVPAEQGSDTGQDAGAALIEDVLSTAVGSAAATLGAPASAAADLAARTVRFARRPEESGPDEAAAAAGRRRRAESDDIAGRLVGATAAFSHQLVSLALSAGPALVSAAEAARTGIDQAAAVGAETVRERVRLHRRSVQHRSAAALERIAEERDGGLRDVATAALRTRLDVAKWYRSALTGLTASEIRQLRAIHALYRTWDRGLRTVGTQVGAEAVSIGGSWATYWLAQRNGESSVLDGPIHDNRLEARADAARQVAAAYQEGLGDEAGKQADAVATGEPEVLAQVSAWAGEARVGLASHYGEICRAVDLARDGSVEQINSSARLLSTGIRSGRTAALTTLSRQERQQTALLGAYARRQKAAVDRDAAAALVAVSEGVATAAGAFNAALGDLVATAADTAAPEPVQTHRLVTEVEGQLRPTAEDLIARTYAGLGASLSAVTAAGVEAAASAIGITDRALAEADGAAEGFAAATLQAVRTAVRGYARLRRVQATSLRDVSGAAQHGFASAQEQLQQAFSSLDNTAQSSFTGAREQLRGALRGSFSDLTRQILEEAKKAADAVQPRWKKVLKAALIIVVVIAAAALTVVSAGSLGVVGTLAVGALIGGASGAAIQIGSNLIDGKKWSDGVGKAIVVGAIGGLFGGAGGLLAKGVGHAGLRLGVELGVDAVGGIVGDLAVGNPITLQGVLIGTAIGAGVGLGVGGLGALKRLKDRLRLRPDIPVTAAPIPRPDVAPPVSVRPPAPRPTVPSTRGPPATRVPLRAPRRAVSTPAEVTPHALPAAAPTVAPRRSSPETPVAATPAAGAPARTTPARAAPEEPMVRAEARSPDRAHELKVLRDGRIIRCSAKCQELREEFKDVLASRPGLRGRLAEISQRAKRDPHRAAAEAAVLEQQLRRIRRTGGEVSLAGLRFRGEQGRDALARHLDAIAGAGTRLSAAARAEILDLAERFGRAVASGTVNRRLIGEVKSLLRRLDAQHVARNPVLATAWHRALRSIAASDSRWAKYLKPDGSPNWAVLRRYPADERDAILLRLYSIARSDRTHGVNRQLGRLMDEINDAFGTLRSQVSQLPLNVEIHHLLYKARHPKHAINPWNLVLALRKSKVGQHDEMHELLHFISMGAGMTRMGADRWNVILDEMAAIIRKVYKL